MNDALLLPLIEGFAVLWVLVWVAEKVWISYTFMRDMRVPNREPMECPNCGQIEFTWAGEIELRNGNHYDEYVCNECKHYATF